MLKQILGIGRMLSGIVLAIASSEAAVPVPRLVKDINQVTLNSSPEHLVVLGDKGYFFADDGVVRGLWKTDGTASGTIIVAPTMGAGLTVVGNSLFFAAAGPNNTWDLWKSDGTAAGTVLVKRVPSTVIDNLSPTNLTAVGGSLFFLIEGAEDQLWTSDGTTEGTVQIRSFAGLGSPPCLTSMGGFLYLVADDGTLGRELWKSDGTPRGTVLVRDIALGMASSDPSFLTAVANRLFFSACEATHGCELWVSDGTEGGTRIVKDLAPGVEGARPYGLTNVAGTLYFGVTYMAGSSDLWRSDGSEAGTTPVMTGSGPVVSPGYLTAVGSTLYFSANFSRGTELWKSDGTPAGTAVVRVLGADGGGSSPHSLVGVGSTLFFCANGAALNGFWRSDGSAAGTVPLAPGVFYSGVALGSLFLGIHDDGLHGTELWKSDGSVEGTSIVRDINANTAGSFPGPIVRFGSRVVISADDGVHGRHLWVSDGTEAGTQPMALGEGGPQGSFGHRFVAVGATLFFVASGETSEEYPVLWRTDGTPAGTARVVRTGPIGTRITAFEAVGSSLYFLGAAPGDGLGLFRSDGTEAGTAMLKGGLGDIQMGPQLVTVGSKLFFVNREPDQAVTLWVCDGTVAGTRTVKSLCQSCASMWSWFAADVAGTLFFGRPDGPLWRSDGTEAGTTPIGGPDLSIRLSPWSSGPVGVGKTAFFGATDGVHGVTLWRSDGTTAGTTMVCGGRADSPSYPSSLRRVGDLLVFAATDSTHGREPWISDGSSDGTFMLVDAAPGSPSGGLVDAVEVGGAIVFTTEGDETWDTTIWVSNGRPEGTHRIEGVRPAGYYFSGGPSYLTSLNGTAYFSGVDPRYGNEVFALTPPGILGTEIPALITTEKGTSASFYLTLNTRPSADVVIPLSSSDVSEGVVAAASLVFTPASWNVAQTVTVTGQDDFVADGDVAFKVRIGPCVSFDPDYDKVMPVAVDVVNRDDDHAGIIVEPKEGLVTTESGGAARFSVRLASQPVANVTIGLVSSDPSEGTVSPAKLDFTPANWSTPQWAVVAGVPDEESDASVAYTINTLPAISADPVYAGLDGPDVSVVNLDATPIPAISVPGLLALVLLVGFLGVWLAGRRQ